MRRQLALVSLAVTSMVVVAFTVPLALLYQRQAEDRAVVAAERRAQAVAAEVAVAAGPGLDRAAIDEVVLSSDGIGELSVILPDDEVVGAPVPVTAAVSRARQGLAFRADTGEVVVPVVTAVGTAVVRVNLLRSDRNEGVGRAWLVLGLLGLGMIALAVLVADRLGRSFVRPVGELAVTAERLGAGELEARVRPAGPPEVVEVGVALNELAGRVEMLLAAERESVADLSHRLRTPLTALRLRADAVDDPEAAAALLAQVDRLQRAVDELIHSARRGSQTTTGVDLGLVARNRSDFWLVLADKQDRSFRIDLPASPVVVEADLSEVTAVIDALVGNVFAHTPAGTDFDLEVRAEGGGMAVLAVDDAGPGFPDRAVVERGESRAGSTGLGLDIARRFAERSGGSLVVGRSPVGGARVEVRLVSQSPSPSPTVSASPLSPAG
jgi:signal transduction histidine kinase